MRVLVLNCTLKPSPAESNTAALLKIATDELERLGAACEQLRPVDYDLRPGTSSDMGDGDQWPELLERIQGCDILIVGTPIWLGWISSVCQRVLERLDAIFHEEQLRDDETGQYYSYNKVAGIVVTGNEDGAHACQARLAYALTEMGFTLPPNSSAYWVGEAGPGPSYLEAGRDDAYSTRMALTMAANLHYFAELLSKHPIPTRLKDIAERVERMSK